MSRFSDHFDRCAYAVLENQLRLSDLIGDHDWALDTAQAKVTFSGGPNGDFTFPVQFLGTHSEVSDSWLWADANKKAKLPESALTLCREVRRRGRELAIAAFGSDKFEITGELGEPDAATLAMFATHLGGADAFYRGPYAKGEVFFAFSDPALRARPALDAEGFRFAFNELIWIPGDSRLRLESYVTARGLRIERAEPELLAFRLPSGELVELRQETTRDGRSETLEIHPPAP